MILRCRLKRRDDPTRICGGLIGGAPDGAMQVGNVELKQPALTGIIKELHRRSLLNGERPTLPPNHDL